MSASSPPTSLPPAPPNTIAPKGVTLISVTVIFFFLATIFVGLRIQARWLQRVKLTLNDYMCFAALLFQAGEGTVIIVGTVLGGVGYHTTQLSMKQLTRLAKAYVAAEPLWISANCCAKISMLHLYITLFWTREFRLVAYAVIGLVAAYWFATIVRMFCLCTPFQYLWDKTIPGTCINLPAAWLSVSIINMILDLIIIALPMPMLWNLRMPVSKKIAVSGIFSLGFIICIITIIRIVAVRQLDVNDLSYTVVGDGIWSAVEPCLSIINACLPVLKPVLVKIFGSHLFTTSRKTTNNTGSSSEPRIGLRMMSPRKPTPTVDASKLETGSDDALVSRQDGYAREDGYMRMPNHPGEIRVTQDWELSTDVEQPRRAVVR